MDPKKFLSNFGLSDTETQIYLGLLETGPTTVLELSKHLSIKRTTVHVNVETLIEAGLVGQTKEGARRRILAEPPERIKLLLEEKQLRLNELESNLQELIKSLKTQTLGTPNKNRADVKFYEGKKAVRKIYEEMGKADLGYSIANADKFYEIMGKEVGNMLWEAMEKNPKREVYDILIESDMVKDFDQRYPRYHCKTLPRFKEDLGFDILIYGDVVALIQLDPKNVFAAVITSNIIATSFKGLQKVIWDLLPGHQL